MDIENLQRLDVRIVRGLDEHGAFVSPGAGDGFVLNQRPRKAIQVSRTLRKVLVDKYRQRGTFKTSSGSKHASRTFRVVHYTITGGASIELVDFFRRGAIEMSWVAIEMSSLFWKKSKTAFSVATLDSAFEVWLLPSADAASA